MNNQICKLMEGFKNPTTETTPAIMWFWNSDINEEGIAFQLEKFREQGIVNFFIHPAGGMRVMYLSDRFFELIKFAVDEAKRTGMKFWIYDENDWPSGMAGGLLREKYPEYRQDELYGEKVTVTPGIRVMLDRKGTFLRAHKINKKNGRYFVTDVTDKCEVIQETDNVNVQYQSFAMQNEEIYFVFSQHSDRVIYAPLSRLGSKGMRGYVNILKEEVIQKWIEMTHEGYKKVVGDEFGKTVMGVFTDEPTSLYRFDGPHPAPWDDEMEEIFEKEHGYSIMPYLYTLFLEPISPEEIKARDDFRTTLKNRYFKAFIYQVSDWCRKNNLLFTGHFGGEEHVPAMMAQGDMMEEAMVMDIPGMDTIGCKYAIDNFDYNVAPKLITSAAKFNGSKIVLSETYTTSGHDYKLWQMKRLGNRILGMGVNMLQYMGAAYSHFGSRKGCFTTYNYENPVFSHFKLYNDYIARIQHLSRQTIPVANVLVFNPIRQIIQKYDMLDKRPGRFVTQEVYEDIVNGLLYKGIGFDMFSENIIENIKVCDGYVEAYGYRYDCVVFPDMHFVNTDTANLVKELRKAGVKMVFAHSVPTIIAETGKNTGIEFSFSPADDYEMEVFVDGNAYMLGIANWPVEHTACASTLKAIIGNPTLNIEADGRVFINERSNEYCKVFFINNDENRKTTAVIDEVPGMVIYNITTGEEVKYPAKDGRISVELEALEMVAAVCDISSDESYNARTEAVAEPASVISIDKFEFEAVDGNQLPVPYEVFDKQTGTWEKGTELTLPASVRLTTCEDYDLRGTVTFDYIPEKVYVNTEIDGMRNFKINGTELEVSVNTVKFSEFDCKLDVTSLIKKGANTVEFTTKTEPTQLYLQPPFTFFSGDFGVIKEEKKAVAPNHTLTAGGWEVQGYPYYSGKGKYTVNVDVADSFTKAEIEVECNDVTEIFVNGEYAGKLAWAPFKLDITKMLKQGANKIELVVTSTNGNLFDMPVVNGITGPVEIKLYK
ncbi:MAG: hypothetical protein IKV89_03050 [Clostridia bacterium]|nr:hypothetical protein [Clostridia bacterium]